MGPEAIPFYTQCVEAEPIVCSSFVVCHFIAFLHVFTPGGSELVWSLTTYKLALFQLNVPLSVTKSDQPFAT